MGPKRAMVDQGRAGEKMKLRVEEDSESEVPNDATSSSGSQSETEQDDASDVFDEEADMEERLPPEAPQPDKSHKLSFHNLTPALNPKVLEAVDALGFTHMTPVQAATLPLFLTHKDVLVEATTGSGKTLAFVLPIVETLLRRERRLKSHEVGALVISPTRELARQIYSVCQFVCRYVENLKPLLLIGGTDVASDVQLLLADEGQGKFVIGTPGRVDDIMQRAEGKVSFKELEMLVLDEADVILDMDFKETVNQILNRLPKQRRTGLFSATQTKEVKALARAGLRNPVVVTVKVQHQTETEQAIPTTLENFYLMCTAEDRVSRLVAFLRAQSKGKVIVFFATCATVDYFAKILEKLLEDAALPVFGLHGRMNPKRRTATYDKYVAAERGILICTDVAARGIDIPDVDWIVQFDPPQDPSFFIHRVGRTARAGKSGRALLFLLPNEDAYVNFLHIRRVPIRELSQEEEVHDVTPTMRTMAIDDRDVLEKGTKAFVSFVRAYNEHQCQFIFRFKELDVGGVARSYGLLRLPRLKEVRGMKVDFQPVDIDTATIKFKDRAREKQRQENLQKMVQEEEKREQEKAKRAEEREARRQERLKAEAKPTRRRKKGRNQAIVEEWEELAEEERLYKRLKKGKISKAEYDAAVRKADCGGDSSEEEPSQKQTDLEAIDRSDSSEGSDSEPEHKTENKGASEAPEPKKKKRTKRKHRKRAGAEDEQVHPSKKKSAAERRLAIKLQRKKNFLQKKLKKASFRKRR